MPQDKDLKRLVRARMEKTGESYTAARAQLIRKATPAPKPLIDYARLGGMSDARVQEKTGRSWEEWTAAFDKLGAAQMAHPEIVSLATDKFKVPDWWAQMVVVGYERIKGLRARGQRRNGTYEMTKSRTYNVPVETLFNAWADARTRQKWLPEPVKVRTSTSPKSIRLDWPGGGIIAVGFTAKGPSKSVVAFSHDKLPDKATADRLKDEWSTRLDALADVLSS